MREESQGCSLPHTEPLPNSRSGVVPAGTVGIRGALRSRRPKCSVGGKLPTHDHPHPAMAGPTQVSGSACHQGRPPPHQTSL